MRRLLLAWLVAPALILLSAAPARADATPPRVVRLVFVGFIGSGDLPLHPLQALGIGVFPDAKGSDAFVREIGRGAPPGYGDKAVDPPRTLQTLLAQAGVAVRLSEARPVALLHEIFEPSSGTGRVLQVESEAFLPPSQPAVPTIEIDVRTSIPIVSIFGIDGLLYARDTGRAGVVTPYDITATILHAFNIPVPTTVAGVPLHVRRSANPQRTIAALRARFIRDARYGGGEAGAFAGFAIVGAVLAALFGRRRPRWSGRFARAAAAVPIGHAAALFAPSSSWVVRSLPLLGACVVAAALPTRDDKRAVGWLLLGGAAILGALTIASALRPNGEPALSFWGDPLISWRFFGVRNHIMAFMCAGALAGASLLEFGNAAFVATAVASGFLVGAPWLGANYIGVTVLAFATTIVMLARMTDTVRWWHVLPGVLVAAGATIAALLSDRSHVSHGGRAVGAVGAHGIKAAWDIFRARASLDYHEVAHLGVWGYLGFIATAATIAYLIVRARTSPSADLPWLVRAGVFGVAAAAFVALFIEDSGFYTGGNLLLAPALAYVVARATRPQAGAGG